MMRQTMKALAAVSSLLLAACSGGTDSSNSQAAQVSTYVSILRASRTPPPPPPQLTPALINRLTVSSLEVTVESTGQTAFLVPYSDRRDTGPGQLRTWRTADDAQLTLRSGVLVTTRGLGNDLGSSQADAAVKAIQSRSPISGPHKLYVKTGNNGISEIDLLCEMRTVGQGSIEIVQRTFPVLHLQENCTGTRGIITYDYWVDRRDSTVWQSRQWAGHEIGYVRTRLLKK